MKTHELVKYFKDKGFRVTRERGTINVFLKNDGGHLMSIREFKEENKKRYHIPTGLKVRLEVLSKLSDDEKKEHYKVIDAYIGTPIKERIDKREYYILNKNFENPMFLVYDINDGTIDSIYDDDYSEFILSDSPIDYYKPMSGIGKKSKFTKLDILFLDDEYKNDEEWEQILDCC